MERWHDFYVAAGGAAAVLLGLLFVSLSLHLKPRSLRVRHALPRWHADHDRPRLRVGVRLVDAHPDKRFCDTSSARLAVG